MMPSSNDHQTSFDRNPQRQFRWYNVGIILFMALGSIEYGYSASIIATTLAQPSFISYFELDTRSDAADLTGLMNSLYQAGGFLGVWTVSVISDRYGRKMAITYCAIVNLIATIGLTASVNISMFLAFRFIAGWGGWTIVTAVPIWMNEVSPPNIRGILVDCHNVGFLLGYNLATWFGYAFYHLPSSNSWAWRGGMAFQALWVVILLGGMHWLPESPRWLMLQERYEEATRTLTKLHTPEQVQFEAVQIRESTERDRHLSSSWKSMVMKPTYRKRALFAMGMALSIHTSGILVITNYGPTIYNSLGFDTNKQLLYQIGWCAVALGTGVMSFFLIDRYPRNKLLSLGVGCCAMCLAIVCGLVGKFASADALKTPNKPALDATIAFIYLVNCFYQLGLDGVQFCSLGEIFPNHIRAKGVVIGVTTICAINVVYLQVAPIAFQNIGYKFYLTFCIPGFVAATWLWFFFPNTLGMPLEEVARLFGDLDESTLPNQDDGKTAVAADAEAESRHECKDLVTEATCGKTQHVESA